MKKNYILSLLFLVLFWQIGLSQVFTKQVIICSGGNYSDPDDFVSIASYDPLTGQTNTFGTIYTQSVQDVIVDEGFAYVAAQDSIVKYNIDTYERIASVAAVGVKKLAINLNTLLATFQFPVEEGFLKIYNSSDLSPISDIEGISDETSGIMIRNNMAYVAVPGNWATTNGKIAWVDLISNTLAAEVDLGEWGKGINDFIWKLPFIYGFISTPWGGSEFGIYAFDEDGAPIESYTFNETLANLTGHDGNSVYAELNGGIGVIDIENMEVSTPNLIPAPANTIVASALDTINDKIYFTTTDYLTSGEGSIYNFDGTLSGSFIAGISAEAIAIDYRNYTSVDEGVFTIKPTVYPNPFKSSLSISAKKEIQELVIYNLYGTEIKRIKGNSLGSIQINTEELNVGTYILQIISANEIHFQKVINE